MLTYSLDRIRSSEYYAEQVDKLRLGNMSDKLAIGIINNKKGCR